MLKSGVHATLAGVLIAFCIPMRRGDGRSPVQDLEKDLHTPVALAILPLFAFANAGISFAAVSIGDLANPVTLGIALGLFLGNPVGILSLVFLASRLRLLSLPAGVTWAQLVGTAFACGIGFTMSLFIAGLAFEHADGSFLGGRQARHTPRLRRIRFGWRRHTRRRPPGATGPQRRLAAAIGGQNGAGRHAGRGSPQAKRRRRVIPMQTATYEMDSLPVPNDDRVTLLRVPGDPVAALGYRGRINASRFAEHAERRCEALRRDGLEPAGEPQSAVYNGPFTPPFMRRNEVLVRLSSYPPDRSNTDVAPASGSAQMNSAPARGRSLTAHHGHRRT